MMPPRTCSKRPLQTELSFLEPTVKPAAIPEALPTEETKFKDITTTTTNHSLSVGSASDATTTGTRTTQPSERRCPWNSPQSMSSVEGSHSHAKTSVTLAKERALQVSAAVCGSSTHESFASYDRESSSWRTLQRCVLAASELYSETWPHSGMIQSGRAYGLPMLERRIVESGCSSWATPQAHDAKQLNGTSTYGRCLPREAKESAWPTPTVHGNYNRKGSSPTSGDGLATAVNWPTPTARDWKDGDCRNASVEANGLLGRVALEHQPKGSLNPDWVEALMGFSPGWTDGLPDEAKPSTRGNRRASRRKRTKDGSG